MCFVRTICNCKACWWRVELAGFESERPLRQIRKTPLTRGFSYLAEREGFEPPEGYKPSTVFKTAAFDRSATSPYKLSLKSQLQPPCGGRPESGREREGLLHGCRRLPSGLASRPSDWSRELAALG